MKFAAASIVFIATAAITYAEVDDADKQVLSFSTSSGTKTYTNWVASGVDDTDDTEAWYQLGTAASSDGNWSPPADAQSGDAYGAECILFQYNAIDSDNTEGMDLQLFWQVNYEVLGASNSDWNTVEIVQAVYDYSAENLATSSSGTDLSSDASTSDSEFRVMLTGNNGVWDNGNSADPIITPGHSISIKMPDETNAEAVRITVDKTFMVYYSAPGYDTSSPVSVTSDDLMTGGEEGTFTAAASLTAAATAIVAASLF